MAGYPFLLKRTLLLGFLYEGQEKGNGWGHSGQVATCGPHRIAGGEDAPLPKSLKGKRK